MITASLTIDIDDDQIEGITFMTSEEQQEVARELMRDLLDQDCEIRINGI